MCQSENLSEVVSLKQSLTTSWCCHCTHMFHSRRPQKAWLDDWYRESWGSGGRDIAPGWQQRGREALVSALPDRLTSRLRQRRSLRRPRPENVFLYCRPAHPSPKAVLDVGCGDGSNLLEFLRVGVPAYGLEPSLPRVKFVENLGISVQVGAAENLRKETFDRTFDLVIANHVLEHSFSPIEFLTGVSRVLEPGGWLFLAVPNQGAEFLLQQFFFVLHLHCFSRSSLLELLRRLGFQQVRVTVGHEIRVLARYLPGQLGPTDLDDASREAEQRLPEEEVRRRVLSGDESGGAISYAWENNVQPYRERRQHHVVGSHQNMHEAKFGRRVSLTWDGEPKLPFAFSPKSGGPAFLWVK